ncbi:carbohydrate-binding protein [Demequina litorisediminis]|uniref:carbohydrate-binding protein n=1 Tax=Demequina litorisediminis TaxID=1849022 RepID=UPI0024E0F619|nr:carbohydrate-binding protein [Demequina litorisediminis]
MTFEGAVYTAQWWTRGEVPGSVAAGAWARVGALETCTAGDVTQWTASAVYVAGDRVVYDGRVYEAAWWTRGTVPGGASGPWQDRGACVDSGESTVETWASSTVYVAGDQVAFDGHLWQARWWTRGTEPGGQWGPWQDLGALPAAS